jgi:hypothetical protein
MFNIKHEEVSQREASSIFRPQFRYAYFTPCKLEGLYLGVCWMKSYEQSVFQVHGHGSDGRCLEDGAWNHRRHVRWHGAELVQLLECV